MIDQSHEMQRIRARRNDIQNILVDRRRRIQVARLMKRHAAAKGF